MNFPKTMILTASLAASIPLVFAQKRPAEAPSWAPKPVELTKYVAPNKPLTRLSDLMAKHKGQANWREAIVRDKTLFADYVYSTPGTKVSRRFHPDTREFWAVMAGHIRFEIEGQEPFVAVKGSMVQVPMQTIYSMESVGDEPSLRLEVNISDAHTLYPGDEQPLDLPGFNFISVTLHRTPAPYDHGNQPHINLFELAKNGGPRYSGQRFVHDDRALANVIYGMEKNLPPYNPKNRGHYHPECAEFWLIMTGQIQYPIEGQPMIIASEGDVVYVPPFTFHAPRFHGDAPSCRLAINGYTNIAHLYDAVTPH
jgi:mannose-6-phosphate isomerase-like protein (cupin superfamily)